MKRRNVESSAECDRTRRDLLSGADIEPRTVRHLADCASCATFGERFAVARESFEAHRADVVPDAGFAARVNAALPSRPGERDAMSWAAIRLLPAALALTLVLGAWCWSRTLSPASITASAPTDDVLTWVLENGGEQP